MIRQTIGRKIATISLAAFLGSTFAPIAAEASTKGRKNTAIVLSAVTLQQLLTGKGKNALILGAGSWYAWKRYNDTKHRR
jgi:hypothetical protein